MKYPRCYIELTNKDGSKGVVDWRDILSVNVDDTLYSAADSCDITLKNDKLLSDWLRKEQDIKIYIGYVKNPAAWTKNELVHIFTGKIDGVRPQFGSEMTVQIVGRDYAALFLDNEFNMAFAERTPSQVAEIIAANRGLTPLVTPTTTIVEQDMYKDKKEWQILQTLAEREGFVCYVTKNKELFFGPAKEETEAAAEFIYRKGEKSNVLGLTIDDSALGVINKVIVRHWNKGKQLIEATALNQSLIDKYQEKQKIVYDSKAKTVAIAQSIADKLLVKLSGSIVTIDGLEIEGMPELETEKMVALQGIGRFDGNYIIGGVKHKYEKSSGYSCSLKLNDEVSDAAAKYRENLNEGDASG